MSYGQVGTTYGKHGVFPTGCADLSTALPQTAYLDATINYFDGCFNAIYFAQSPFKLGFSLNI